MRYTRRMRETIIACNWKTNPERWSEAQQLYRVLVEASKSLKETDIWVAPPSPFIEGLSGRRTLKRVQIGAQDCSRFSAGAQTGEISAKMLKEAGAQFVIVGHSERRALGDSEADVNVKMRQAQKVGLHTLLCVGERLRDEHGEYLSVIAGQVRSALHDVPKSVVRSLVIAYEPLWAIGEHAAAPDIPEDFRSVAIYIKKIVSEHVGTGAALSVPVLYGGSVTKENAVSFVSDGGADGLLIGRASLKISSIKSILADVEAFKKARLAKKTINERTR